MNAVIPHAQARSHPLAAPDVEVGECWANRGHRSLAEIRDEEEAMPLIQVAEDHLRRLKRERQLYRNTASIDVEISRVEAAIARARKDEWQWTR